MLKCIRLNTFVKKILLWNNAPDFNNPQYMRTKTTVEPDKTAIKEAIKGGVQIDGAAIVTKENLSIK